MSKATMREEWGEHGGEVYALNKRIAELEEQLADLKRQNQHNLNCYTEEHDALMAYKATGCTPEEINGMAFDAILDIKFGVSIDRLRELAEADRDGRCVVLPCKVGDTQRPCEFCGSHDDGDKRLYPKEGYVFYAGYSKQYAVDEFDEDETDEVNFCPVCGRKLTVAEAEAALKEETT